MGATPMLAKREVDLCITVSAGVDHPATIFTSFYVNEDASDDVVVGNSFLTVNNLDYLIQYANTMNNGDDVMKFDMTPLSRSDPLLYVDDLPPREVEHHDDPQLLAKIETLCEEYADIFDIPTQPADVPAFKIKLNPNADLPYTPPRRMAPKVMADLRTEVDDLVRLRIMRKSTSSVASPCVPVRKPDGTYRLCADYRELNEATEPMRYPTPSREATLQLLRGHKYFATLDLWKGFHQFAVDADTIPLTAVNFPWGLYEYLRMPFGVKNGTAVFQSGMDSAFEDYLNDFVTIFVDDLCTFADTPDDHVANLRKIFERCRQKGLHLKRSKCDFTLQCVDFLGYVAGPSGYTMSNSRRQGLRDIHPPKSASKVRSFIGVANTFRDFIPKLSVIAKPLTALCGKGSIFNWTPDCQTAFENIKTLAEQAPVLQFPDPSKKLLLQTDASTQ